MTTPPAKSAVITLRSIRALKRSMKLKSRKSTAYPAVGPDVTHAGAEYVEIPVDQAMTDGNLVSAPAWIAHPIWMAQFVGVMGAKIEL